MFARRILVSGNVQGVFFRATTKEVADTLGVHGWVRNLDDGRVEIHAEGSEEALKQLEEWCKHGPQRAIVDSVEIRSVDVEDFSSFEIL